MSSSWVGFLSTKRMHLASMPMNNQSDSFLEKQSLKTNSINSTPSILIFAFWVDARWSAWPSYRNGSISWLKPPDGLWLRQRIRPGRLSLISERVNRKVPRRRAHFPISLARERERWSSNIATSSSCSAVRVICTLGYIYICGRENGVYVCVCAPLNELLD